MSLKDVRRLIAYLLLFANAGWAFIAFVSIMVIGGYEAVEPNSIILSAEAGFTFASMLYGLWMIYLCAKGKDCGAVEKIDPNAWEKLGL